MDLQQRSLYLGLAHRLLVNEYDEEALATASGLGADLFDEDKDMITVSPKARCPTCRQYPCVCDRLSVDADGDHGHGNNDNNDNRLGDGSSVVLGNPKAVCPTCRKYPCRCYYSNDANFGLVIIEMPPKAACTSCGRARCNGQCQRS